jgi:hypothetical protein
MAGECGMHSHVPSKGDRSNSCCLATS